VEHTRVGALVALVGLVVVATGAEAQCSTLVRVRENDCLAGDRAGFSVGIDGDYLITGSVRDDGKGADSGAAHVFIRTELGWVQQVKLQSDIGEAGDFAGSAVAIAGDDAFVGMPYAGDNGYVCQHHRENDQWVETARLVGGMPENGGKFGSAVAAHGNWMIAGAPNGHGALGNRTGAVAVFKRAGEGYWEPYQRTYQEDGAEGDGFGSAIAVRAAHGVIGAPWRSAPGFTHCGSVTMFSSGTLGDSFSAPDKQANARFGAAVAMGEGYMVVGAPDAKVGNADQAGAAYVYAVVAGDPVFKQKLTNGQGNAFKRFGAAVAVAGTSVFVAEANNGTVIRFDLGQDGTWAPSAEIVDPDSPDDGQFGRSLATDGERLVVGDDMDDYVQLDFADAGAAYVMDLPPPCPADTDGNGVLDLFDFLGFQNLFVAHDARADMDCSGVYDFFDFLAYQNVFSAGCG
jgi:hypothetical protein